MLTKASVYIWIRKKELPSYQCIITKTTYCVFNYWLTHKSIKKWWWSKKEMLLKNIFSLKFIVFDSRNSSRHPLLLSDLLIYLLQKSTCNHPLLHVQYIWQIFLFQEYCYFRGMLTAIDFEWIVSISGGHF